MRDGRDPSKARRVGRWWEEIFHGGILIGVLTMANLAGAQGIGLEIACPAGVRPGAPIQLQVRLRNDECRPLDVRLISSLVGNAANLASGTPSGAVGIFGPEVAGRVVVPAARDGEPTSCDAGFCSGSFVSCSRDEDCQCLPEAITPGELTLTMPAAHSYPASFAGVVARQFVVADVPGTTFRDDEVCTVPEPGAQAWAAVCALCAFAALRAGNQRGSPRS